MLILDDLSYHSVAELDDLVSHVLYRLVVGHHDYRGVVFLVHRFDQLQYLLGRVVIQRAGGLVAEQYVRILDDGAPDGAPLLLSAGKLGRQLVPVLVKPQRFQDIVHVQRVVAEVRAGLDVLLDIEVRDKVVHLEYVPEVAAAVIRQRLFLHILDLFAVDGDVAAVRVVDTSDDVQKGGFSAAGGTEQYAEFSLFDAEADTPEHVHLAFAGAVALFDVADLYKHDHSSFHNYLLSFEQLFICSL